MIYFLFSYLLGGLPFALALLALYLIFKLNNRISSLELKLFADSLNQQKSIKEQIIGALDFQLRSSKKLPRKNKGKS